MRKATSSPFPVLMLFAAAALTVYATRCNQDCTQFQLGNPPKPEAGALGTCNSTNVVVEPLPTSK